MGCCESKLLGIQDTPEIYQQNPITQNHSYDGNLVPIAPVPKNKKTPDQKAKSQLENQSVADLQINLNKAFKGYEEREGKVTYTCLINAQQKTLRSTVSAKMHRQQISYNSILLDEEDSQTIFSESKSESFYPTQILKDVTLDSINNLDKELYWSEYAIVNGMTLKKWDNKTRKDIQFTKEECIFIFAQISQIQEFVIFMEVYWFTVVHNMKLIAYSQESDHQIGLRIFLNGFARLFTPALTNNPAQIPNSIQLIHHYCSHFYSSFDNKQLSSIVQLMYHLSGWLPEIIDMKQIETHEGMFERLSVNVRKKNVMVCFIREERQICVVEKIDCVQEEIVFSRVSKDEQKKDPMLLFELQREKWDYFLDDHISMCVNWNPSIYEFSTCCRLQFTKPPSQLLAFPHILLELPPSQNQLQVRIFIQEHSSTYQQATHAKLLLFDYSGDRKNISEQVAVKSYEMNSKLLTDIMLFESCPIASRYLLVLIPSENENNFYKSSQYTLQFYTLTEIKVEKLDPIIFQTEKSFETPVTLENVGMGLTSPFYLKNQALSIKIPPCHLLRVASSPQINDSHLDYQLHLIPCHKKASNIVQLRPDDIATSQFISPRFQRKGFLEIQPRNTKFILIVCLYSIKIENNLILNFECLDVERAKIFEKRGISGGQIQIENSYFPKVQKILSYDLKWNSGNPGLRNRTKQNTKPIYQKQLVFTTFFRNPYIDFQLESGTYYFILSSKSYQSYFEQTYMKEIRDLTIEEKENAQALAQRPPNLSLGIFHISKSAEQEKMVKIIADDEFYVPFGFGYWCKKKIVQKGMYRFVFSKLQKCSQAGIFQIKKILQ